EPAPVSAVKISASDPQMSTIGGRRCHASTHGSSAGARDVPLHESVKRQNHAGLASTTAASARAAIVHTYSAVVQTERGVSARQTRGTCITAKQIAEQARRTAVQRARLSRAWGSLPSWAV